MSVEQDDPSPAPAAPRPPLPSPPPPPQAVFRRRRLVVAAGAAAVALTVGGGLAVALSGDGEPSRRPVKPTVAAAPPEWTVKAGRLLASGPGVRYDGALTVGGRPVLARLRITREGSATGTLTAGPLTADVVAVDGATYLRAGVAFWRDYAGEVAHPEYYAGRWSKAPAALPGFDVPGVLGPEPIARTLAKAPPRPATEDVGGRPAYKVRTPSAEYLVASAAPYRLLAVRATGPNAPWFTASPVAAPASMFAELRSRVARLGGASDPGLRFRPGTLTFSNCDKNTNGCTVTVPATLASPAGTVPSGARAALRASIASRGRPLGSCAGSGPVPSSRALVLTCTVKSGLWRRWVRTALDNPGSYPYAATAQVIGEAVAVADVPKLLAAVDRERSSVAQPEPATPGTAGSGPPGSGPA
ncbi:hypothetical protein [Actinomadura decatromicini]|uniref:Uncharacterized protein n=1 Tax=Actinomadura decatromicini TaxID=2604572 RepID=A0A5D3FGB2_9ACTN|nr:hypothetical protein [Actinomadura decatromicini]TYK47129.1 hypothetical protein FXF68_25320 [Actinomadura decatromicini]